MLSLKALAATSRSLMWSLKNRKREETLDAFTGTHRRRIVWKIPGPIFLAFHIFANEIGKAVKGRPNLSVVQDIAKYIRRKIIDIVTRMMIIIYIYHYYIYIYLSIFHIYYIDIFNYIYIIYINYINFDTVREFSREMLNYTMFYIYTYICRRSVTYFLIILILRYTFRIGL